MSDWQHYETGRRVACVNELPEWKNSCTIWPRQGQVLTVRAAKMGLDCNCGLALGLRFQEFESYSTVADLEPQDGFWWFPAECFKPLDEARLEQFRAYLVTPPTVAKNVTVDA
jgi:hypothetical protein